MKRRAGWKVIADMKDVFRESLEQVTARYVKSLHHVAVGRELKMMQLEKEVAILRERGLPDAVIVGQEMRLREPSNGITDE